MTEVEFLIWVRGPGFQIATVIFVVGILLRLFEILMMGRKVNLAEPKGSEMAGGMRTIMTRSLHLAATGSSAYSQTAGYIFHIGLFVTILLFAPHILVFQEVFGVKWPSLPTTAIDAITVITIITMFAVLAHRLQNPVIRFLSTFDDYFAWFVTLLPLVTGYLAFHRIGLPAPSLLAIHILSVELLMVVFPFTKLTHAFTLFLARWYNGAISGYRGVES